MIAVVKRVDREILNHAVRASPPSIAFIFPEAVDLSPYHLGNRPSASRADRWTEICFLLMRYKRWLMEREGGSGRFGLR